MRLRKIAAFMVFVAVTMIGGKSEASSWRMDFSGVFTVDLFNAKSLVGESFTGTIVWDNVTTDHYYEEWGIGDAKYTAYDSTFSMATSTGLSLVSSPYFETYATKDVEDLVEIDAYDYVLGAHWGLWFQDSRADTISSVNLDTLIPELLLGNWRQSPYFRFSTFGEFAVEGPVLSMSITEISPVPLPAGVWLFGTALAGMGLIGRNRKKKQKQLEAAA